MGGTESAELHLLGVRVHLLVSSKEELRRPDAIFYDGHCGLSHRAVMFLLRHDGAGVFRFSPIQGRTFQAQIPAALRATLPDSMVVQTGDGSVLTGPLAWIYVLRRIGGVWRLAAAVMNAVPRPVSEFVYRVVARTRYWFFGRRQKLHPRLSAAWRSRFDD